MQCCKYRFVVDQQLLFDVDLNSLRIIVLIAVFLVIGISLSPKHLSSFWVRTQLLSEDAIVCDSVKPLAHSNCRISLYKRPTGRLEWGRAQQKSLDGVLLSSMSSFSKDEKFCKENRLLINLDSLLSCFRSIYFVYGKLTSEFHITSSVCLFLSLSLDLNCCLSSHIRW